MANRVLVLGAVAAAAVLAVGAAGYFWLQDQKPVVPAAAPVSALASIDLPTLKDKAAKGDAQAQLQLGKAFAAGLVVKRDYKQAAQFFEQAANKGNSEAQAALGELCQAGQGVPRDLPRAIKLFQSAADAGNVTAQYDLGFNYEQGQGVHPDRKEAAKWYRLASEGGDPTAQYDYGQRCVLGVGVAKDPVEGLKWLLLAAAGGQADAASRARDVESTLSGAQVSEAKRAAAAFVPRKAGK